MKEKAYRQKIICVENSTFAPYSCISAAGCVWMWMIKMSCKVHSSKASMFNFDYVLQWKKSSNTAEMMIAIINPAKKETPHSFKGQ